MARGFNPNEKFVRLGRVTSGFGEPTKQESFHGGVDIANSYGTPINAPVDGVVTKGEDGHVQGENNFGNQIELKDNQGNLHQFNHLGKIGVKPGQRISKGQPMAGMGNSGATYSESGQGDGTNLDYRIVSAYGKYIDPTPFSNNL